MRVRLRRDARVARLDNTVSTGIVSARRQEPEGYQLLQITAPASPGSSGGAVLSADGDVLGIAVSQLPSGQNLNFAVPINHARGMLQNRGDTRLAVLGPMALSGADGGNRRVARATTVNRGSAFDLQGLNGHVVESAVDLGDEGVRRTRVSYRLIETVRFEGDRDALAGRSVEFVTFDPWTGEIANDRYDVLGEEEMGEPGAERPVLRVNVATGLANETVFFERHRPRTTVRRVSQDGTQIESATSTATFGNPR